MTGEKLSRIRSGLASGKVRATHLLQSSAETLHEILASCKSLPGVGRHQRREHGSQANAVLARTGIPSQQGTLALPAAALGAAPAGVEITALIARHPGTSVYGSKTKIQSRTIRFVPKVPGWCPWVDGGIYGC